ncbi:hypothetical protein GF327_02115 [Candidatus Woesearchaeota archaeon]|nr:hypothetical protein [Candidatus Woesearchaeota archaeon]
MEDNNFNWKSSVWFHVMIDRFCNPDGFSKELRKEYKKHLASTEDYPAEFAGGKISGITINLDYIAELGADVLYLSPFFKNDDAGTNYHGYHAVDFREVDPRFGTIQDLEKLIEKAHEKGLKVVMDFVPNHCSTKHPFFKDAKEKKDKRDWFYFKEDQEKYPDINFKDKKYLTYLGVDALAKINLDNSSARDYMIETAKFWLDKGIDGLRLDHVIGPSDTFWKKFNNEIKKYETEHDRDIFLVGEACVDKSFADNKNTILVGDRNFRKQLIEKYEKDPIEAQQDLQLHYEEMFDGIIDFAFLKLLRGYLQDESDEEKFERKLESHFEKYDNSYLPLLLVENHDTNQIAAGHENWEYVHKKAVQIMFEQDFPVMVYYASLLGKKQEIPDIRSVAYGDSHSRPVCPDELDQKNDRYSLYQKLISGKKS